MFTLIRLFSILIYDLSLLISILSYKDIIKKELDMCFQIQWLLARSGQWGVEMWLPWTEMRYSIGYKNQILKIECEKISSAFHDF